MVQMKFGSVWSQLRYNSCLTRRRLIKEFRQDVYVDKSHLAYLYIGTIQHDESAHTAQTR